MTKQLVKYIAFMAVMLTLGAINWVMALTPPLNWWIFAIAIVGTITGFVAAWRAYRIAMLMAEIIDSDRNLQMELQLQLWRSTIYGNDEVTPQESNNIDDSEDIGAPV